MLHLSLNKRAAAEKDESEFGRMEAPVPPVGRAHGGPTDATSWLHQQLRSSELKVPQTQNFSIQTNLPERMAAHAPQSEADILLECRGKGWGRPSFENGVNRCEQ